MRFKRMTAVEMLPARVHAAIRAQEDQTERLIGWIQLAPIPDGGTNS